MRKITVILEGSPGVGKTRMVQEAIAPWCRQNGFVTVDVHNVTDAALAEIERVHDKVCLIREKQ